MFDCDGVIWKGDTLIEGVPDQRLTWGPKACQDEEGSNQRLGVTGSSSWPDDHLPPPLSSDLREGSVNKKKHVARSAAFFNHCLPSLVMKKGLVCETLEYLKALGKRLFFVTNNSTKSRAHRVPQVLTQTSAGMRKG